MQLMAQNGLMAGDRHDEISAEARRLVAEGLGNQLMLVPGWWYVISANTFVEFLDHCPDIVALADQIPCRTLFVRSDDEPPDVYPAEELAQRSLHPVSIDVGDHGGHYYLDREANVSQIVTTWLADVLEPRRA